MTAATTTRLAEFGESMVIVKNVPCHKCEQCGEASINIAVSERLEQIIGGMKNNLTEVMIVRYSDAA